jgi:Fe-S-cluster containining protein
MAEAVRRSGSWIACKPGCYECCIGPFPITLSDAERLRAGMRELERLDPDRAARVRTRVAEHKGGEDEPCPVLDPEGGTCDLYEARPITCRIFGPAVRAGGDGIGVCELCYHGASDEEIASCVVEVEIEDDEEQTTVAVAIAG